MRRDSENILMMSAALFCHFDDHVIAGCFSLLRRCRRQCACNHWWSWYCRVSEVFAALTKATLPAVLADRVTAVPNAHVTAMLLLPSRRSPQQPSPWCPGLLLSLRRSPQQPSPWCPGLLLSSRRSPQQPSPWCPGLLLSSRRFRKLPVCSLW